MHSRSGTKNIELSSLEKVRTIDPSLLKADTVSETNEYLSKIGITLPRSEDAPLGFIKLWPEDFIVEEVNKNQEVISIFPEKYQFEEMRNGKKKIIVKGNLIKCNIGTLEALQEISNQTGCNIQSFAYAGLKDHDALTAQEITITTTKPELLKDFTTDFLTLTNLKKVTERIKPGGLYGNRFTLFVRTDKTPSEDELKEKISNVQKNGFWNFYYTQRFGNNGRLNGHLLGKLVIEQKYEEAFKQFITEAPDLSPVFAKKIYKQIDENYGDWQIIEKIISAFPMTFERELAMISYIKNNPNDFKGALKAQPNEVKLWLLGFASWLFNLKLSEHAKQDSCPETIPLVTSMNTDDQETYFDIFEVIGLPREKIDFEILKEFNVQRAKEPVLSKNTVEMTDAYTTNDGIILRFTLPKGSYATTFLSHFITLVAGNVPEGISHKRFDTTKTLGEESITELTDLFAKAIEK